MLIKHNARRAEQEQKSQGSMEYPVEQFVFCFVQRYYSPTRRVYTILGLIYSFSFFWKKPKSSGLNVSLFMISGA